MPSPAGWHEVPCVECGKHAQGIDFGDRCRDCQKRRQKRASRLGRHAALIATAMTGAWVLLDLPASTMARFYAATAVPVTYLLVRMIVGRLAMELLP
jgi:hypothetical protein